MEITHTTIREMEKSLRTTLINSLPGYKCLQLVGTTNENGHSNLGLFNSIVHIGASPALLGMVFRPQSENHDTLRNIIRIGHYSFNSVTQAFVEKAHQTSARYPSGFSEFVECGFTEFFIPNFEAPFVAESPIKIGLSLRDIVPLKINNTTMVIGEIIHINMSNELMAEDGYIDHQKAGSLTVNGLDSYATAEPIARYSYAKPDRALKRL